MVTTQEKAATQAVLRHGVVNRVKLSVLDVDACTYNIDLN
jgi:hypothetical protein